MDDARFDALARAAAPATSRRSALRLLVGGLLGGRLAALAGGATAAANTCPGGLIACADPAGGNVPADPDFCVDPATNPFHCGGCGRACTDGAVCRGGACRVPATSPASAPRICGPGLTTCAGRCVDTDFDLLNCGRCGQFCGGRCSLGTCLPVEV